MKPQIIIYGPGCQKCHTLENLVQSAVRELGVDAEVTKISDISRFAEAGIVQTPALSIDGRIWSEGRLPQAAEVKSMIADALSPQAPSGGACCGGSCACEEAKTSSCSREGSGYSGGSCDSGGCCSSGKRPFSPKLLVLGIVGIIFLLVAVKNMNRANNAEHDAKAATSSATVAIQADRTELIYYRFGERCSTCERMEKWISEVVQERFSQDLAAGTLVYGASDANEASVSAYNLTTKSLIAKTMVENQQSKWISFDRIWDLNEKEAEFKDYVATELTKLFKP